MASTQRETRSRHLNPTRDQTTRARPPGGRRIGHRRTPGPDDLRWGPPYISVACSRRRPLVAGVLCQRGESPSGARVCNWVYWAARPGRGRDRVASARASCVHPGRVRFVRGRALQMMPFSWACVPCGPLLPRAYLATLPFRMWSGEIFLVVSDLVIQG
jgi:hypothetical protein